MKIVELKGGLGNQLFIYSYYIYLCQKFPEQSCYIYAPKRHLGAHNGLEIDKWFDVQLKYNIKSHIVASILYWGSKILRNLSLPIPFLSTDEQSVEEVLFHDGYWQNKKYIDVRYIRYKNLTLSRQNIVALNKIRTCNSISIHFRKGDYSLYPEIFEGICTKEYYYNCIKYIKSKVQNCVFFVFSDDLDYAKEILAAEEIIVVDWNRGKNSFFDMFLMSRCKYMILANSTFSYWSAILNEDVEEVICPSKWSNVNPPDIILDRWTIITS